MKLIRDPSFRNKVHWNFKPNIPGAKRSLTPAHERMAESRSAGGTLLLFWDIRSVALPRGSNVREAVFACQWNYASWQAMGWRCGDDGLSMLSLDCPWELRLSSCITSIEQREFPSGVKRIYCTVLPISGCCQLIICIDKQKQPPYTLTHRSSTLSKKRR